MSKVIHEYFCTFVVPKTGQYGWSMIDLSEKVERVDNIADLLKRVQDEISEGHPVVLTSLPTLIRTTTTQ